MQQSDLFSMDKIKTGVLAAGWSLGLLIAGSDGVFMPWLNGIGLMLFFYPAGFWGTGCSIWTTPGMKIFF